MPSIAVVVPAHNMAKVIARCIGSLKACRFPSEKLAIHVIADHCTDDTAARAAGLGVTVLKRDDGQAGKSYALAWTFEKLAERGVRADQYVVTDATAWVDAGFLAALAARRSAGEDIVVGRSVAATENQPWFVHCLALTLVHRNYQNECRERLGLSSLIEGRGMAYGDGYIGRHGWSLAIPAGNPHAVHPTEDWRHGVRVVEHGYRVAFAGDARVYTPLRESLAAATQQGARWERGRMVNAMTHGLRLLRIGLREFDRLKIFAALDAIQLPVAILGALTVVLAAIACIWPASRPVQVLGFLPLAVFGLYGLVVAWRGRREGIRLRTVVWAPVYIAWRSLAFLLAWFRK